MLKHCGTQMLETENLILRQFCREDAVWAHKNWASDEVIQELYCEPVYPHLQDVQNLIESYLNGYCSVDYYRWAVISKINNQCIGQIAYYLVDTKNKFAEIEYCIGKDFQKNGYATEATMAVKKYGFEKIKLHKIQICHRQSNIASKKVIEKCGFSYDGALRDFFCIQGVYQDRLYYSILETEYNG